MWPRKQLDIDWSDFAFGMRKTFRHRSRPPEADILGRRWIPPHQALVSLSVRTGWDLLLATLNFAAGGEILMSSVTIRDMVRIVEHHGLSAVPVDVDADRLEPNVADLERWITPRTRAILVAHLFGSRIDMEPIIRLARQHDLLVIEDCAQAFAGCDYAGHEESDCSLFSFGPIKTATALGGAIVRVRDPDLRDRMAALQRHYPIQTNRTYAARIAKYAALRSLCKRRVYGGLVRSLRALGINYDETFGNAAHSFGPTGFFERIRRQPCLPLVEMLKRRIGAFECRGAQRLLRRTLRGERLARSLPPGMIVGSQNASHTYWALPVRVSNRDEVLAALRAAGFDATARSSLVVVSEKNVAITNGSSSAPWLAETIFLPNGDDMPDDEWQRMSSVLREVARAAPTPEVCRHREFPAVSRVSVPS